MTKQSHLEKGPLVNPPIKCPYCLDSDFNTSFTYCPGCGARQHDVCWGEHKACAACGENTRSEKTQLQKEPKKGIAPTKLIMGIVIIVAILSAAILIPPSRLILAIIVLFGFDSFLKWLND